MSIRILGFLRAATVLPALLDPSTIVHSCGFWRVVDPSLALVAGVVDLAISAKDTVFEGFEVLVEGGLGVFAWPFDKSRAFCPICRVADSRFAICVVMMLEALIKCPVSVYSRKMCSRSSSLDCSFRFLARVEASRIKSLALKIADSTVWWSSWRSWDADFWGAEMWGSWERRSELWQKTFLGLAGPVKVFLLALGTSKSGLGERLRGSDESWKVNLGTVTGGVSKSSGSSWSSVSMRSSRSGGGELGGSAIS